MSRPELSIVVPVLNEEDNVQPLVASVRDALGDRYDWELLFVDDGSTDATAARVREACVADSRVRLIPLARRYGQATAMQAGFDHCGGDVVVTMDGDLQNDPADIPKLVATLREGYDLVAGYRVRRQDTWLTRKVPSWVANRLIRWLTGVPIRDNGCSLKAYRRELIDRMKLYSDLHRFLPALATGTAAARIAEVDVRHHPRVAGRSSYGLSRVWKVLIDLLTIEMIRSFRLRPVTLFIGMAGLCLLLSLLLALGGLMSAAGAPVRSLAFASVILLVISLAGYLSMLGLLAEFFVRVTGRDRGSQAPLVKELVA